MQIACEKYVIDVPIASDEVGTAEWMWNARRIAVENDLGISNYHRLESLSIVSQIDPLISIVSLDQLLCLPRLSRLSICCQNMNDSWGFGRFQQLTHLCLLWGNFTASLFKEPMLNLKKLTIRNEGSFIVTRNLGELVPMIPNIQSLKIDFPYTNIYQLSRLTNLTSLKIFILDVEDVILPTIRKLSFYTISGPMHQYASLKIQLDKLTVPSLDEYSYHYAMTHQEIQELKITKYIGLQKCAEMLVNLSVTKLCLVEGINPCLLYYVSHMSALRHLCLEMPTDTENVESALFLIRNMRLYTLEFTDLLYTPQIMEMLRKMPCLRRVRFSDGWLSL
jgi:hypothetical protein